MNGKNKLVTTGNKNEKKFKRRNGRFKGTKNTLTRQPRQNKVSRSKVIDPLAKTADVKFVFNDVNYAIPLTVGNGYADEFVFMANDLYDPDYTGGGVSPYGFDQLMGTYGNALFNWWRVYAAKITVYIKKLTINPSTTDVNNLVRMAIVPNTQYTSLPYTGFDDLLQYKGTTAKTFKGANNNIVKISNYIKMKDMMPLGTNPDDQWVSSATGHPGDKICWHVYADGNGTITADSTVIFDVKIKYYSKLMKVTPINES